MWTEGHGARRWLVFGAAGQVGLALRAAATTAPHHTLTGLTRDDVDITDVDAVRRGLREFRPHVVINAAAFTAVDAAEARPAEAFSVNRDGARIVAEACVRANAALVHLSTDYVFDGRAERPYDETSPTAPLNVYGASKLAGEEAVRGVHTMALVLRTSWIIGARGRNFVRSIVRAAASRERLEVVDDQRGCPTPADALASALLVLADPAEGVHPAGILHYRGAPPVTWCGLARAIVERLPAPRPEVVAVTSDRYPAAAIRPAYSVLACDRATREHGLEPPSWSEALDRDVPAILRALRRGDPVDR